MSTENQYVARADDLNKLKEIWNTIEGSGFKTIHLTAPMGGGKRAMVGELCKSAIADNDNVLICRPSFSDEEDGQGAMINLYKSLFSFIHGNPKLRGRLEMGLNSQIPTQPARVQQWYRVFIDGLKKGAPKPGSNEFQISIPKDNPLLAYLEIIQGIARKFPVILDFQNLHNVQSLPFYTMLEAFIDEGNKNAAQLKIMLILHKLPTDGNESWMSLPLQDILKRHEEKISNIALQPWDAEDVTRHMVSKGIENNSLAAHIADITNGRPGFIAEMVDWVQEDEEFAAALPEKTLETLIDLTPDEDELEEPKEKSDDKQQRKHATVEDADNIAYLAATLGLSYPSGLIADMGNYTRSSVDDIFDATENIYEELQRSEPLNTWVYKFKKALIRDSILARRKEENDKKIAGNIGMFLERFFVPQGYGYLSKTMRIYAQADLNNRAAALRNVAMSADNPQFWNLSRDIFKYYDECEWPDPMVRTTLMHLADRLTNMGDVNTGENVLQEAFTWAQQKDDKLMRAFLLMAGSRLDRRRQDLYRSRDRAQEALNIYKELDNPQQEGEALAQLALIELADGQPNAALDKAKQAEERSPNPPVQALCRFIQGSVDQRERKFDTAIKKYEEANQLAGKAGRALLALESGMKVGECLLASRELAKAADVLSQVAQMARQIRAPSQERAINAMLAQAQGGQQNFEAALKAASRALEITKQLGFSQLESVDTYNVGLFNLMMKRPSEAVALFKQAREKLPANSSAGFTKELLFNLGMAQIQIGERNTGQQALAASIQPATQMKDWNKVLVGHQQLAELARASGNISAAKDHLNQALAVANNTNNKEVRKQLKEKIRALR